MLRGLISFAFAASATAAVAQTGQVTGSVRHDDGPIDVPEGRSTGDAARAVSDNFALCIVKRHRVQVLKTLSNPWNMTSDYKYLPKLMDGECFTGSGSVGQIYGGQGVELQTNPMAFRGALYKALVRKDFSRGRATFGATALVMAGDNARILQFADCVVRRDPDNSLGLIQAIAGSKGEDAALAALQPNFTKCVVQGSGLRFSKGSLVGLLAEAYYREAAASISTSPR